MTDRDRIEKLVEALKSEHKQRYGNTHGVERRGDECDTCQLIAETEAYLATGPWVCMQCGETFPENALYTGEVAPYGKDHCHTVACDDGTGEPEPCPCGPVKRQSPADPVSDVNARVVDLSEIRRFSFSDIIPGVIFPDPNGVACWFADVRKLKDRLDSAGLLAKDKP